MEHVLPTVPKDFEVGVVANALDACNPFLSILLGLLPTAASLTLYFSGLAYIRAQNASIIALLEPISAVVFTFVILNQPITSTILAGGELILLSALMVSGK